jgi:hypothetical protein
MVDVRGLDVADHFRPEGEPLFQGLYHCFFKRRTKQSPSIEDLKRAIKSGRLG